jgi:hypothetical protein
MKSTFAIGVAILISLSFPFAANASLGGGTNSVEADRVFLKGKLKSTAKQYYSVQEIDTPNGVTVREYASNAGAVFGVAWQGPRRPDLRQVLGPYFDMYSKAIQLRRASRFPYVRGPVRIEENGFVVEMGGHGRWYVGRAYVQGLIPSGVTAKEIQ